MKVTHLFYFFFVNSITSSVLSENPLLMTTSFDQIAKTAECVLKLSAKYFVEKKALSGSIVIININSYVSTTQGLFLSTIHGGIKYSVMVKDSFYPHRNASHFPEKAKNYMLILEERSELLRNILQLNKLPTWNPLAKTVVYYQAKENETGENISMAFINELLQYKLLKSIVIIYYPQKEEIVSFTWSPYSDINCGGECESVFVLDRCKDNLIQQIEAQKEVFPLDLKGCPLIVYAVVSEPYVMPPTGKLTNTSFDDAYEFQKGSEINLVKIISQFTNMSLIIRMSDTAENWGIAYPNGTSTGAYGLLRNDSVDLVIGNIEVTRTLRQWFDPTVSYTQDEMTWCVPRARQASTWNSLVIIFQWSTWICTFAGVIMMSLIFHYLYYKELDKKVATWPTNSLLMTFSMLLGMKETIEPKTPTFRILIFCWIFFSINLRISYESVLRSFLMHPRFEKQIRSESDLIESGISLGGREIYRSYFGTNNSFYLYRQYNSTLFTEGIKRAALDKNFAVVSSRRQAEYQDQKLGEGKSLIFCFPESHNLYKYNVVLLARKWFPLVERFNSIIRRVTENGFIEKSNKMFTHTATSVVTGTIVPLGLPHLCGAFILIGLLYLASAIVFVGELVFEYYQRHNLKKISFSFAYGFKFDKYLREKKIFRSSQQNQSVPTFNCQQINNIV